MNQKGFANIVLVVIIVAIVAIGGYFVFVKKLPQVVQKTITPTPSQVTNEERKIISPDGTLLAVVTSSSTKESKVVIQEKDNKRVLTSVDFSSSDGEHGEVVDRMFWTSDSRFFVFNTYSSGGHQPWRTPTYIFNRTSNNMYDLDDFLSPQGAASGSFELSGNKITLQEWLYSGQNHKTITLDLSTLPFIKHNLLKDNPYKYWSLCFYPFS